ncbi:MAG: sulfotransferase [Xanthomonadales bacterium]|nr:sulfotransferase [Xanthomonadales bacterium]
MSESCPGAAEVHVPSGLHAQSRFFAATRGLWLRLAALESAALGDEIRDIPIDRPVYVTSLPRSGTTILVEMLARHPALTSHRYSDFPNVWTPYWRNYLLQKTRRQAPPKQERAHRDRIEVSGDSPEAVEEVLWMHFFPDSHDPKSSSVLDGSRRNATFDTFYRDHIRKLLVVRSASRYLAKGNYNLARIGYLRALFSDAKFLIPIRDPLHHVASLEKQHRLFCRAGAQDPRVPLQLALAGHFEFGPRRRPLNLGDDAQVDGIREAWAAGRSVDGWSRYWAMTYRYLLDLLESDQDAADACLLFRYETLCQSSATVIDRILEHCELPLAGFEQTRESYCRHLKLPDYYAPDFSSDEQDLIHENCTAVYERLCRWIEKPV